jgi:hypothetical protein
MTQILLLMEEKGWKQIDYRNLPGDSTIKDSTGEDQVDKMMKG